MTLITALFFVNSLLPHPQVWALFALQALAVAVFSLGRPAMSSLAPRLVPDDEIAASLGDLEAGVLASLTSLRFSIVSGGVLCIGGCVATALALPAFLHYDAREPRA